MGLSSIGVLPFFHVYQRNWAQFPRPPIIVIERMLRTEPGHSDILHSPV